jgi:hypothetical protein
MLTLIYLRESRLKSKQQCRVIGYLTKWRQGNERQQNHYDDMTQVMVSFHTSDLDIRPGWKRHSVLVYPHLVVWHHVPSVGILCLVVSFDSALKRIVGNWFSSRKLCLPAPRSR